MTTTVVKTIGVGGDYTTLQAWEDASPASLVAVDQIWQGQIRSATDNFSQSAVQLTFAGTTVDATRYKELTTATGASFRDNAGRQGNRLAFNASAGCSIESTGTFAQTVLVQENFVRLSNLQIRATSASSIALISQQGGTPGHVWDNLIVEGAINPIAQAWGSTIRNCIFIATSGGLAYVTQFENGDTIVNCMIVVPADLTPATAANHGRFAANVWKNCAFFGVSQLEDTVAPTWTTNYTDVNFPPAGNTTVAFSSAQFASINASGRDYRLVSGSALIDQGTTDATNAANDIVGTVRPQGAAYDVGPWEFVAAAVASSVLLGQACL